MRKKTMKLFGVSLICFTLFFNTKGLAEENEPGLFKGINSIKHITHDYVKETLKETI